MGAESPPRPGTLFRAREVVPTNHHRLPLVGARRDLDPEHPRGHDDLLAVAQQTLTYRETRVCRWGGGVTVL